MESEVSLVYLHVGRCSVIPGVARSFVRFGPAVFCCPASLVLLLDPNLDLSLAASMAYRPRPITTGRCSYYLIRPLRKCVVTLTTAPPQPTSVKYLPRQTPPRRDIHKIPWERQRASCPADVRVRSTPYRAPDSVPPPSCLALHSALSQCGFRLRAPKNSQAGATILSSVFAPPDDISKSSLFSPFESYPLLLSTHSHVRRRYCCLYPFPPDLFLWQRQSHNFVSIRKRCAA
jgi:hypothetical protein